MKRKKRASYGRTYFRKVTRPDHGKTHHKQAVVAKRRKRRKLNRKFQQRLRQRSRNK